MHTLQKSAADPEHYAGSVIILKFGPEHYAGSVIILKFDPEHYAGSVNILKFDRILKSLTTKLFIVKIIFE